MANNISKIKIAVGVIGTIFLSILSSYLYDVFFKEGLNKFTVLILNYFHTYRDTFIYVEVSKGFHNYESQFIFSFIVGLSCGLALVLFTRTAKKKYPNFNISNKESYFWLDLLFPIFFFFFLFAQQMQLSLINELITNFYQKLNIVTPYINQNQKDQQTPIRIFY